MSKLVPILAGLISATLILAAVSYEDTKQASAFQQTQRLRTLDHLSTIRANIEGELNARLSLVYGLAALAKTNPNLSNADFHVYANSLIGKHTGIRSIQLAPQGVVTHIHPIKGNEAALGHDLLADPINREAALRAIRDRKFVIAGPVTLRQGGVALIGRKPIFLPAEKSSTGTSAETFWGFSIILIDLDPLLQASGVIGGTDEMVYALRGMHGLGASGDIFFGDPSLFDGNSITLDITLPNGSWQLAGLPAGGWTSYWPNREWVWVFGIILSTLVGYLVFSLVRKTRALRAQINDRKLVEDTLVFISQRGWEQSGEDFFPSLVNYLGTTLEVDYAFVDTLLRDNKTARTVGLYAMGQFPDNIEYDLNWTPCENVIGKNFCCYPERIKQLFPKDDLLEQMGAESYAGIPLWDSHRKPIGLIAVMDKKSLADPARIETVLQLVAVRAAHELERMRDQQELILAKEEAIAANNAKSEFLASMSHDLRTPLNAIMGFSEMMHSEIFGPLGHAKYEEYTLDISKSSKLLVSLINDILDLNKIEAGKYVLHEEVLAVEDLIIACTNMVSPQSKAKSISITTQIEENMPRLRGDERVITQTLNNLISNSVKFSHEDSDVLVACGTNKDGAISIRVIDTGIGMTPEETRKAMNPFEQTDSTLSRQHEGTGLGLPLCDKFMTLHGGNLEIESTKGDGTTVTVIFPAIRSIHSSNDATQHHVGLSAVGKPID